MNTLTACLFTVAAYSLWLILIDRILQKRKQGAVSLKDFLENHKGPVTIVWLRKCKDKMEKHGK